MAWQDSGTLQRLTECGAVPGDRVGQLYDGLTRREASWCYWVSLPGGLSMAVVTCVEESQPGLQLVPLLPKSLRGEDPQAGCVAVATQALSQVLGRICADYGCQHLWSNMRIPGVQCWVDALVVNGFHCLSSRFRWSCERRDLVLETQGNRPLMVGRNDIYLEDMSHDAVLSSVPLRCAVAAVHADTADPVDALRLVAPEVYLGQLVDAAADVDGMLWVLARRGPSVVGYACFAHDGDDVWIYDVGVVSDVRGSGVGRHLVSCGLGRWAGHSLTGESSGSGGVCHALIDVRNEVSAVLHGRLGLVKRQDGESMWHLGPQV